MEAYEVYRLYMAIKLHFTTESYDLRVTKGSLRDCSKSFAKRKDIMAFRKLGQKYSKKEIINFLVANFVQGNKYGGVFDRESEEIYQDWINRRQRLGYMFTQDLITLFNETPINEDPILSSNGNHPMVVKLYLGKKISIETLIILDKLFDFRYSNDTLLENDFVWKEVSLLVRKYSMFVKVDKDKFLKLWNKEKGIVVS